MAVPTVMTGLAILLAITALYHGAGAVQRLPHLLSSVLGVRRVAPEQVCPKVHSALVMTQGRTLLALLQQFPQASTMRTESRSACSAVRQNVMSTFCTCSHIYETQKFHMLKRIIKTRTVLF